MKTFNNFLKSESENLQHNSCQLYHAQAFQVMSALPFRASHDGGPVDPFVQSTEPHHLAKFIRAKGPQCCNFICRVLGQQKVWSFHAFAHTTCRILVVILACEAQHPTFHLPFCICYPECPFFCFNSCLIFQKLFVEVV